MVPKVTSANYLQKSTSELALSDWCKREVSRKVPDLTFSPVAKHAANFGRKKKGGRKCSRNKEAERAIKKVLKISKRPTVKPYQKGKTDSRMA